MHILSLCKLLTVGTLKRHNLVTIKLLIVTLMSRNLKFSQMFHQKSNSNLLTVSYVLLKMLKSQLSDGFLTVHSSARATPAKT